MEDQCNIGNNFISLAVQFVIASLYMYRRWRSNYQEAGCDHMNRFNTATLVCLFKPGPGIPNVTCRGFFVFSEFN